MKKYQATSVGVNALQQCLDEINNAGVEIVQILPPSAENRYAFYTFITCREVKDEQKDCLSEQKTEKKRRGRPRKEQK